MKKTMRRKSYLIYLIIGPTLSLVAFILAYLINPLQFNEQSSLAAIPAFLLSVIILIITQIIATHKEVEKVTNDSYNLYETVKNYIHITKIGTPKKAWEYIIHRLPVIEYVQNTSFNFGDESEQSNERLYDAQAYQQSAMKIARHIEQGLTWKDIGDTTSIDRFRKIESCIKGNKSTGSYIFKSISQTEPQIGFVLLTYKDGTTEVLFNWDFRDIPQDPVVLLSRDREIFNMFAAQFKGLWRVAVQDYDSMATKSTS
ncbi:MAG: hypothetical protein LBC71_06300 [Oscillospiraceae bacterium]|jgi:hypothetical protein|nr:hypothetical protein [Oscillospiraceae bacterium]